jgi:hypothetical protein
MNQSTHQFVFACRYIFEVKNYIEVRMKSVTPPIVSSFNQSGVGLPIVDKSQSAAQSNSHVPRLTLAHISGPPALTPRLGIEKPMCTGAVFDPRAWLRGGEAMGATNAFAQFVDKQVIHRLTGKFLLSSSQQEHDTAVVEQINKLMFSKVSKLPASLEEDFGSHPKTMEREAAHSRYIRIFIHKSKLPQQARELCESMTPEQRLVGLVYLSAIDKGMEWTKSQYPDIFPHIEWFARKYLAEADKDEKQYYRSSNLPESFKEGARVRPLTDERIPLGPKFVRHPISALMLGEFRRVFSPEEQVKVDEHFHRRNMASRPKLVQQMRDGKRQITSLPGGVTKTVYATPIQVELYADKTQTMNRDFATKLQDGDTFLTTQGRVTQYSYQGKDVYVVEYNNFKASTDTWRFLVARAIPIGDAGETYTPEIQSFATAEKMALEALA